MNIKPLAIAMLVSLSMAAIPAWAVSFIQIGTWTGGTPAGPPLDEAGLKTGGKYVIHSTYNPATVSSTATNIGGLNFYEANLQAAGNSFQILAPMEGFDGGTPFIYDQNQLDHFPYPGAPVPTIQFTNPGGAPGDFFGYTYSGNLEPGTNNHFIDIYTTVVPIDIGGGTIVNTPFQNTDAIRCPDSSCGSLPLAINSVDSLVNAVNPLVNAGNNKAFSAGSLSATTDGGALQSNNLGASRTDGEDFLNFDWTEGGSPLTGTMTPDGVNIAVAIENSGLNNTTDTATWQVEINEDLTGLGGHTDTMTVSYTNAGPTALPGSNLAYNSSTTSVTANGGVSDPDLAVNALIAGFESHTFAWEEGGSGLPGGNNASVAVAIQNSGLTNTIDTTTFDLTVTDLAGDSDTQSITVSYTNTDPVINDFSAIPSGNDMNFALAVSDVDLGINSLIPGFEELSIEIFESGVLLSIFDPLINTGSQFMDHAALLANFGVGPTILEARVYDLALGSANYLSAVVDFTVNPSGEPVPTPTTLAFLLAGLLGLGVSRRRTMA